MKYKTYKEYQKAFSELNFILNNLEEEIQKKIPDRVKTLIKNNMDENYIVKLNLDIGLENCVLLDKTRDLLSLIYRDYICSKEERDELISVWKKKNY